MFVSCKQNENEPSHETMDLTISINDTKYHYSIAIPSDYKESTAIPALLALHWGGNVDINSGFSYLQYFVLPATKEFDGIIISPACPEASGWIHPNSKQFILALIDKIKTDYNIDPSKFAISGYSMGGIGTWYYAVTYPNIFSAAIPIASMPSSSIRPITDIIPTYVIHGEDDEIFTYNVVESLVSDIKIKNNTIKLVKVENATHYQTDSYKNHLSDAIDWLIDRWNN